MMVHMEGKQWQRWAHSGTPFPVFQQLWDNGCRGERDKGTSEGKRKKKSFLWFIYDARKVSWTHQNMQQWSFCQGRWSVFIVDWTNEWERKEGKRKWERGGQLYCIRVLTISSLPHHHTRHKMATSFLHAASAMAVGVGGGGVWRHFYLISHLCRLLLHSSSAISHVHIHLCWVASLCNLKRNSRFSFFSTK